MADIRRSMIDSSMNGLGLPDARIVLLIPQHLANAPRAQKEASALAKAGAEVIVLGSWWNQRASEEDLVIADRLGFRFVALVDLRPRAGGKLVRRAIGALSRLLYSQLGMVLPELYGVTARKMVAAVRSIHPDLTMVHCEPGLWAGSRLMQDGFKVGIDFEDWFSEDLLPEARIHRPVEALSKAETRLLKDGAVCFATTEAMALALQAWAGANSAPTVIPNCFPWAAAPAGNQENLDGRSATAVSFHWYSQTIGPGRGLETLAAALSQLRGNWELHLRGRFGANSEWYEAIFPRCIRDRIRIHDPVPNDRLPLHCSSHDVGLALESPFCRSRDLTATNKIFEYLRCGLAVVATKTTGQMEVMSRCPKAGWLVEPECGEGLIKALQCCIDHPTVVAAAKSAARHAASGAWAWENFEQRLVSDVANALAE